MIEERVEKLLEQLILCDFRTEVGIDKATELIRRAFKNEQKLTRHKCAENVANDCQTDEDDNLDFCAGWDQALDIAHNVIINTKSI